MSELDDRPDAADWELASAYLDGDVDEAGRAHVEGSSDLRGKAAELRAVRAELSVAVTPPAGALESAMAAAFTALDGGAPTLAADRAASTATAVRADVPAFAAPVVDIATARRHRRRRSSWFLGAAAASIVAVLAVVSIGNRDGDDASTVAQQSSATGQQRTASNESGQQQDSGGALAPAPATTFTSVIAPAATAASPAPAARAADAAQPAGASPTAIISVDSPGQLLTLDRPTVVAPAPTTIAAATATTTAAAASTAAGATTTAAPSRCVRAPVVSLGAITYQGQPAIAIVDDVRHVREALDATTCTVLASVADTP